MTRILLLGGTTEARLLATRLAKTGADAVFSYAGRTSNPIVQPLPTRIGGFGGIEGLARYLQDEGITHVVDGTHAFAAQMSRNTVAACYKCSVPLIALERPAWVAQPGDQWINVPDTEGAVVALPKDPARVFLAIGRQSLAAFAPKPQHHYLIRLVDPPGGDLPLPDCTVILERGPFDEAADRKLIADHGITHIVAKNAGGDGGRAKIDAARILGLPVIMIARPTLPDRPVATSVDEVMDWLAHTTRLGV